MENWVLLLRTADAAHAAIVRGLLEENNVPVVLLNKQDSSYVLLGEIEIYVPAAFRSLAQALLSGTLTN